jgi:hypothetical protein
LKIDVALMDLKTRMTTPKQLEFTDCLGCGKRISTTASVCHHCQTECDSSSQSESHAALNIGGYGQDDWDDDQRENASTRRGLWWYVALALLIFFVLSALLPALF